MSRKVFIPFVLILSFSILYIHPLSATHIVGGELNYKCLGNDQYEITLTIYRDCFNGDPNAFFDNPASIGVFDTSNQLVTSVVPGGQLLVTFNGDDTLNPQLLDPCFVVPPNVCVHTTTYVDTITLPFRSGGYTLVYQRCCRNRTILNIVNPLASGATYLAEISEEALRSCNSNPVFKEWPPAYICVDQEINFDHSATDFDGDSLVYRLCTPLLGANQINPRPQPPNNPPYDTVVWVSPPYSRDNMLGGVPFSIDPVTGRLSGIPNTIGQFVVGICVDEYRNGMLISSTRRDFQYNVGQCGETTAAFFTSDFICEDELLVFENNSSDADKFEWNIRSTNFDTTSFDREPQIKVPGPGFYQVRLIASNERGCTDTFSTQIEVLPLAVQAGFSVSFGECLDSVELIITDESINNDTGNVSIQYVLIDHLMNRDSTPPFFLSDTQTVTIIQTITGSSGCSDSDTLLVQSPFLSLSFPDTLVLCRGENIFLNPSFDPDCTFKWSSSLNLSDPNASNPAVVEANNSAYVYVQVQKDSLCPVQDSIWIEVEDIADIINLTVIENPVLLGQTHTILFNVTGADSLVWIPEDIINNISATSLEILTDSTQGFTLIALSENGCNDTAQIILEITRPPCEEPFVYIPNAFSPNNDGENDFFAVRSNYITELRGFVYNRWGNKVFTFRSINDEWDGTFRGEEAAIDGYGYYFEYRCEPGGQLYKKKGNVSLIR
jgi:gliding motility-associated-like protein